MRKLESIVKYESKGELVEFEDNLLRTQVIKNDNITEDEVNFDSLIADVENFCKVNKDKNVEIKFSIKCVE